MCEDNQNPVPETCKNEFKSIHTKLDDIDEAIRGNGKPGINTRLDRLEQFARFLCFLTGLLLMGVISTWLKGS